MIVGSANLQILKKKKPCSRYDNCGQESSNAWTLLRGWIWGWWRSESSVSERTEENPQFLCMI